ncbi:MAG: SDR family oxidoreductase, partial [Bradyrhizobium sp.]|nr:SDR family oxidoreductase [Bradyrhizobium sp.]
MRTFSLRGHVALVTGGSRGIGAAIVKMLGEAGCSVAVNYRERAAEAEALAKAIVTAGGKSVAIAADVSQTEAVAAMVQRASAELGPIDILVNNAGVAIVRGVDDLTEADFDQTILVNLKSAFLCTQAVLPGMRAKKWGRIVNISSGAAYRPLEGWSAYCAGKAGLAMVTRSIALETAGKVRIFGFSPGTIDTDMQVKIRASGMNQISQIPRADLSPVEHAVRGLVYLCDTASDDLIGQDVS